MSLVLADRVRETTTSTGTGTITLGGAVLGFQSFSVIGNNNTTYYTISGGTQWEVGIGTYYGGTLARTTVIASSTGSKLDLAAGSKDVFVTYPAEKSVNQDVNNRVLIPYTSGITDIGSLNVGSATLHTDSGVIAGFTASEPLYLYTSLQNTDSGATSYASYAVNDGGHTAYGELGINNANYSYSAAGFPNNGFSTPLASFVESYGGPLVLGSWDNQKISFIVNGSVNTTDAMTINTNGSVAFNGQVGTSGQVLQSNATSAPTWVTLSSGTVTSVAATVPSFLSVTGSPITTSGTLAITLSGTALPIANGGTGASTAADARTNLGLGTAAVLSAGSANGAATLDAGGTVPLAQLPASLTGGVSYQGTWNATTNTPTLTSSVGTKGYYYVISVAGSTNLNGITDWKIGDWAIFNGSVWEKVDNTESVTSVNGYTGTVTLAYSDLGTVPVVNGGTNITTYATGDILYASATNTLSKLTAGTNGYVLTLASGVPTWATASGGTPGGSSGQLQYNNSGSFGGITNVTVKSGQTTARIDPRVLVGSNSATSVTPDISLYDMYVWEALSTASTLTISAPTGTPLNGDKLMFRIQDDGSTGAVSLSWATSGSGYYRPIGVPLPTTTVVGKVTYVGCIYNSLSLTWDVIASGTQV